MFALGRINPDPASRRFLEIPFTIDSQVVGDAWRRVFADVDEHHTVRERAVWLDLITLNEAANLRPLNAAISAWMRGVKTRSV